MSEKTPPVQAPTPENEVDAAARDQTAEPTVVLPEKIEGEGLGPHTLDALLVLGADGRGGLHPTAREFAAGWARSLLLQNQELRTRGDEQERAAKEHQKEKVSMSSEIAGLKATNKSREQFRPLVKASEGLGILFAVAGLEVVKTGFDLLGWAITAGGVILLFVSYRVDHGQKP